MERHFFIYQALKITHQMKHNKHRKSNDGIAAP